MAKTREIKKRIKAVGNIRRITKTMQMIATSKFARAAAAATATKPYTEGLFGLVTELAATAGEVKHPLMGGAADGTKSEKKGGELTLVLTSDRGLCGPYNGSILRTFMQHIRSHGAAQPNSGGSIELVGKKGAGFLKYNNVPVSKVHSIGDKPTFDVIARLAEDYMTRFVAGEISAVRVVYMRFISAGRQAPDVLQLLPLKPVEKKNVAGGAAAAGGAGPSVDYDFSPPAEELLGDLLPATVKATLFQVFNDAIVSEHVARMVAMKAATDNAGKMRKLYTRDYNRARQAQITTELSEIIAGAAALG
ncbi:MAG: ATP synthase F1 subunit gamma [Phycisphaerales bacterium]|nr:ATP synthase F1 subunit gamma [Phycisphaerales bacterium]